MKRLYITLFALSFATGCALFDWLDGSDDEDGKIEINNYGDNNETNVGENKNAPAPTPTPVPTVVP
jgi:hypothetical protein